MKNSIKLFTLTLLFVISGCSDDSDEDVNDVNSCDVAIENTLIAQQNFTDADTDDFSSLCEEYKSALQSQIELCGDDDGNLQATLNNLGNCEQDQEPNALMTANINGVQYNDMKPNGFGGFFSDAVQIVRYPYKNEQDYIKIQGDNTYNEVFPGNTTKEINLFIPENAWQEGTYILETYIIGPENDENGYDEVLPHFDISFFYESNTQAYESDYGGTISITNFDLEERLIEGTFEFQYITSNLDTNVVSGPFDCTDGTFSYSLDDDYFD